MGHIGTDIHEVGDTVATLALSIALEELAYLEKEHDKHSLRELSLGSRQETYEQGTNGGHRHEEMLIESIAMTQALDGLLECVVTNEEVRNHVDEQQVDS